MSAKGATRLARASSTQRMTLKALHIVSCRTRMHPSLSRPCCEQLVRCTPEPPSQPPEP